MYLYWFFLYQWLYVLAPELKLDSYGIKTIKSKKTGYYNTIFFYNNKWKRNPRIKQSWKNNAIEISVEHKVQLT